MLTDKTQTNLRPDIQALRGMALIGVLAFHLSSSIFPNGYLGVDIFFVISGFVITPKLLFIFERNSLKDKLFKLWSFYQKRFWRLFPALWITLIFTTFVILLFGAANDLYRFFGQALLSTFFLGNIGAYHFSGGDYFLPNPNPIIHLWSLSAEEQIYFIIPIGLLAVATATKVVRRNRTLFLFVPIVLICWLFDRYFAAHLLSTFGVSRPSNLEFYLPFSRLWEFGIGGMAAISFRNFSSEARRFRILKFLFLASFLLILNRTFNGTSLEFCLLTFIYLGVPFFQVAPGYLSVLTALGNRSYSIYLVHMPLVYVFHTSEFVQGMPPILRNLCALAGSLLGGSLLWSRVEQPMRLKGDKIEKVKITFAHKFVVCLTLVTLALGFFWAHADLLGMNPNPSQPPIASSLDQACHRDDGLSACAYEVPKSSGTALLIGDSHAAAISQAFVDSASKNNLSSYVWTKSGCSILLPEDIPDAMRKIVSGWGSSGTANQSCYSHNRRVMRWISLHPQSIVVITLRSSAFRPREIPIWAWQRSIMVALHNIEAMDKHVLFLGPVPEFPDKLKFFSGNLSLFSGSPNYQKTFELRNIQPDSFNGNNFFSINLRKSGITFIPTSQKFCNSKLCTRWDLHDHVWLYRDTDHLSVAGAKIIYPILDSWFKVSRQA